MKLVDPKTRKGMTLLELVIATTLLASVVTAVSFVMRTSRAAWMAHEADFVRLESAHATVRHIVRKARQASSVAAISTATDTSGSLSLLMSDGSTIVWDHNDSTDQVNYGITTASDLLSEQITALKFVGYKADGTTATTDAAEIQSVRIEATTQLPRDSGGTRKVASWAWIRSW